MGIMWDKKDIITKKNFFQVAAVSDTGKGLENVWNKEDSIKIYLSDGTTVSSDPSN
jgi:hypothetical protein